MYSWIDVTPDDWFYNEVMEATNYVMENGERFVQGITYNVFKDGAPYVYEEMKAVKGQTSYTINKYFVPSPDNPLYVYVDGVQTLYQSVNPDSSSGTTTVTLYAPINNEGSILSFVCYGIPLVDRFGKPVYNGDPAPYPSYTLNFGGQEGTYVYNPFSNTYLEYLSAFGRNLRRAHIDDSEWINASDPNDVAAKYIGLSTDVYCVNPFTHTLYVPYNLNGVTCHFVYNFRDQYGVIKKLQGDFKPTSPNVLFNNRFFPNALITRAEAITLINKLRKSFYQRFTDMDAPTNVLDQTIIAYDGQRVFKLNGLYPNGTGQLVVTLDDRPCSVGVDYQEFDDHTVLFNYPVTKGSKVRFQFTKTKSSRGLQDVGYDAQMFDEDDQTYIPLGGDNPNAWWVPPVLEMEQEYFTDPQTGEKTYLISGISLNFFTDFGDIVVDSMYEPKYLPESQAPNYKTYFLPFTPLRRAEALTFLYKFKYWALEKFK